MLAGPTPEARRRAKPVLQGVFPISHRASLVESFPRSEYADRAGMAEFRYEVQHLADRQSRSAGRIDATCVAGYRLHTFQATPARRAASVPATSPGRVPNPTQRPLAAARARVLPRTRHHFILDRVTVLRAPDAGAPAEYKSRLKVPVSSRRHGEYAGFSSPKNGHNGPAPYCLAPRPDPSTLRSRPYAYLSNCVAAGTAPALAIRRSPSTERTGRTWTPRGSAMQETTNQEPERADPIKVLSAWTALEVLSPQAFQRQKDDRSASLPGLKDEDLPWFTADAATAPLPSGYQLMLGTLDLAESLERLIEIYGDGRPERPPMRGKAILAAATADASGMPVPDSGVAVSSFAWGLPRALQGELHRLDGWPSESPQLTNWLRKQLGSETPDAESEPLDADRLKTTFLRLLKDLGLEQLVPEPTLWIRTVCSRRGNDPPKPPDPPLLNSFVLDDIIKARGLFANERNTAQLAALKQYVKGVPPRTQAPLSGDSEERYQTIRALTQPAMFPAGRWPGRGRYPLVLNQQLAVNAAMHPPADFRNFRILAVNGPPGTGKTTLLRDIVAANLVKRAEAMAGFDEPAQAFARACPGAKLEGKTVSWHSVHDKLAGYEMLVVSSNNKAVENVTKELPESRPSRRTRTNFAISAPYRTGSARERPGDSSPPCSGTRRTGASSWARSGLTTTRACAVT